VLTRKASTLAMDEDLVLLRIVVSPEKELFRV
jgi:hypothetical protein